MKLLIQLRANVLAKTGRLIQQKFISITKPSLISPLPGAVMDIAESKPALLAKNALLCQQLLVLNPQVKHPIFKQKGRLALVIIASLVSYWKQTLLILKLDTMLGWHRQGFRLLWKFKSKSKGRKPRTGAETVAMIKDRRFTLLCEGRLMVWNEK